MMKNYQSWNRYPKVSNQKIENLDSNLVFSSEERTYLAYGQGRSYGDVCLNENGILIDTSDTSTLLTFDEETGIIQCEAGITFDELLKITVNSGWFLPVVPGTRFITLGGAIANDIHGKNHHNSGSFGNFVKEFELLRSDNTKMVCNAQINSNYFHATIGGMGLTGVITWAKIQLKRINNSYLNTQTFRFTGIEEYRQLNNKLESEWEYTVAWIDILKNKNLKSRGVFHSGQHSSGDINKRHREISINVPFTPPLSLVNNLSGSIINELYFRKNKQKKDTLIHYKPFFFPLDVIKSWNRAYGPKGFIQYQFLLPDNSSLEGINKILDNIIESDQKPFLGVIKKFGKIKPNGLMSFPREGTTLALDFKNNKKTHLLLNRLDEIVIDYEGSLYPAKDSRMSQKIFESSFPNLNEFTKFIDPNFSSSFWRRLRD